VTEEKLENLEVTDYPEGLVLHKEDNTKVNLKQIRSDSVEWINLTQDMDKWQAVVKMVQNIWVP
jgi:type I site-specific restriction-modification system R (restriction) subunit